MAVQAVPLPITVGNSVTPANRKPNRLLFFMIIFYLLFLFLECAHGPQTPFPRYVFPTETSPRTNEKTTPVNPLNPTHKADPDSDLTVNVLRLKHAASSGPETLLDLCFKPTQRRYGCRPNFVSGGVSTGGGTDARFTR